MHMVTMMARVGARVYSGDLGQVNELFTLSSKTGLTRGRFK